MERKTQINLWYVVLALIGVILLREVWVQSQTVQTIPYSGYFLFEAHDGPDAKGINILGKAPSPEAAFRLIELWIGRPQTA